MRVDASPPVLVLAPMRSELRPVVRALGLRRTGRQDRYAGELPDGAPVVAALIGVGPAMAGKATQALLDELAPRHVVVSGVAGGIDPSLPVGTMVVPEVVLDLATGEERRPSGLGGVELAGAIATTAEFITAAHDLEELRARGALAVDMESSAVGAACEQRGTGWTVFRCISDRPHDGMVDDAVFGLLRPDGSADPLAALRLVVAQPRRAPDLVRLARDTGRAATRAARIAARACELIA